MRVSQVIGRVILARAEETVRGGRWLIAVPLTAAEIQAGPQDRSPSGEGVVVYDELGAANGMVIAVSEGAEAAAPFHPKPKPLDAYNSAILDSVDVTPM